MEPSVNAPIERVSLIAALSKGRRAIGNRNALLWQLPGDLPRFKALTMGHPIIMGQRTFASIGKPLPGRRNIVLSRNPAFQHDDVLVCRDLPAALAAAKTEGTGETFVIGGGMVYAAALPYANRLYLTLVSDEPNADAFFPAYEPWFATITSTEAHPEAKPPYVFTVLDRSAPGPVV